MKNRPIFLLSDFSDAQSGRAVSNHNPSGVEHLSPAGGIKRGAIQNDRLARIAGYRRVQNLGLKLIKKRIGIIKMLSHVLIWRGRSLKLEARCQKSDARV